MLAAAKAEAHNAGESDWHVSVDSMIARAHQHSATAKREDRAQLGQLAGGSIE